MNNLEIRKIATALYWKEDVDLSEYDVADIKAILEDVSIIRMNEDKANEIVDRINEGDIIQNWGLFCYGL